MIRSTLVAATLGTVLLAGCASIDVQGGAPSSELAASIEQELALDPLLNTSRVTVTEADGRVVLNGFADDLEDIDEIRSIIEGVEGVVEVENNVIVQAGS